MAARHQNRPEDGDFGGSTNGKTDSTFSGIGPRFGSDAGITLGRGFSLRGRLGLSALVGSQQYTVAYNQNSIYRDAFNLPPNFTRIHQDLGRWLGASHYS